MSKLGFGMVMSAFISPLSYYPVLSPWQCQWLKDKLGVVLKFLDGPLRGYVDYNCNQDTWSYDIGSWRIYALCESGTWRPGRKCLNNP